MSPPTEKQDLGVDKVALFGASSGYKSPLINR